MTSVYDERGPERVSVAGRRWAEWEVTVGVRKMSKATATGGCVSCLKESELSSAETGGWDRGREGGAAIRWHFW